MEGKLMKTPQTKPAELNDLFRATDARAGGRVIRALSRANKRNKLSNHTTMSTPSPTAAKSPSRYSVGMFSAGEARCDRWQELAHAAQTLVAQASTGAAPTDTRARLPAPLPS